MSTDGTLKAVLFERDCGATTGFSSQVSLFQTQEDLPNESANLFIADDNHGHARGNERGALSVDIKWLGRRHLEIRYPRFARVFKAQRNLRDVEIDYVAE